MSKLISFFRLTCLTCLMGGTRELWCLPLLFLTFKNEASYTWWPLDTCTHSRCLCLQPRHWLLPPSVCTSLLLWRINRARAWMYVRWHKENHNETYTAVIKWKVGDNVRGKWRDRDGKRKTNESCYGCVEVNITPANPAEQNWHTKSLQTNPR